MKLGAVLPQNELSTSEAIEFALGLEKLGFDYMLAYEHVLGADPADHPEQKFIYTYRDSFQEPLVTFAYLAALTERLEFVTGILVLPQRKTALVAKQAAQLHLLSGGRFRLGVGAGWNRPEAEGLGSDFSNRGRRMDEQLELLGRLWREPLVDFEGRFHRLRRLGLNPLPERPVPLWVGGYAPPVLRRAARHAQGWIPSTLPSGQEAALVARLHEFLRVEGRDPATFGLDARILCREPEPGWQAIYEKWRGLGATHLRFNTLGAGLKGAAEHLDVLEKARQKFLEWEKP
ncbi:MAG: LLM class F420-dependent oxidoreductase [Vulcanimicrobiota bacterium]